MKEIPFHLKKYIVEQKDSQYTPVEQASWRFILRQLKNFMTKNAHPFYLEGLEKTGISVEEIPSIKKISNRLQEFGWLAAPVSGFIPPAAFLELQAHKILPIASDMRTLSHLMYTPAPDIVHEAAGHAPMTAHPEFRSYLEYYSHIAKKALINKKDLALYEAIRELSDIKEHPNSTEAEIEVVQKKLEQISHNMGEPSEASILSRMAWWTTEYGLVGNPPKIYGAGLLSSFGESKTALEDKVQKIEMSLDCIRYSYDITEPQPQLFVTPDFKTLKIILDQLAETMSFKKGGLYGLKQAQLAETVNSVELQSGLQISGLLKDIKEKKGQAYYLKFEGPSQLCFQDQEISDQGAKRHAHGYSTPIGLLRNATKCLSEMSESELGDLGLKESEVVHLTWASGIELKGKLKNFTRKNGKLVLLTFTDCTVIEGNAFLFEPAWGEFDLAAGVNVVSVFAGAADKEKYGEFSDFKVQNIPPKKYTESEQQLFKLYQKVRDLRKNLKEESQPEENLKSILNQLESYPADWLLSLEILELAKSIKIKNAWVEVLEKSLQQKAETNKDMGYFIKEGIRLSDRLFI